MYAIGLKKDIKGAQAFEIEKPKVTKDDEVLLKIVHAGICGSDRSMIVYDSKDLPEGEDKIVLGHEAVGRVEEVGKKVKGLKVGDYVVPTVRRGCGVCLNCQMNQSDSCSTGFFKERGLHKLHGFFSEYIVDKEEFLVKVPKGLEDLAVLTEPMSIGEKVIENVGKIQSRIQWACPSATGKADIHDKHQYHKDEWGYCKRALVFGAGPIGFLAVCILRLAGVTTFVLENKDEDNIRVKLIKELGCTYIDSRKVTPNEITKITGPLDIMIEATGVSDYALNMLSSLSRNGIYVMTGIARGEREVCLDGNKLLSQIVRQNQVIIGVVNSNKDHFTKALEHLGELKKRFPKVAEQIVTRHIPLRSFDEINKELMQKDREHIKVVIDA